MEDWMKEAMERRAACEYLYREEESFDAYCEMVSKMLLYKESVLIRYLIDIGKLKRRN